MLTELRVKNYALIKDLVFKPGHNFNVITGETGAGKSILLGAMGLILGERADSVAVKENEEKCVVEGFFNVKGYFLQPWFDKNEFDYSDDLIIRRDILVSGKSRAFINDTPAQLNQLKDLGKYLIDIHSQHDNLDLFQKSFQFRVLDSFAGSEPEHQQYSKAFNELKQLKATLWELEEKESKGSDERDFKQFLYEELLAAQLIPDELASLEEELQALTNSENTVKTVGIIHNQLTESEMALMDQLAGIRNQLIGVAKTDKRFEEVSGRLNESYFVLQDISRQIEQMVEVTHTDPQRLETVNQRVSLLNHLIKKHKVDDLIAKKEQLASELKAFSNSDGLMHNLKEHIELKESECRTHAKVLSSKRGEQSTLLQNQMNEMIIQLGMPGAQIKVEVISKENNALSAYGYDDVNMLFSPAAGKSFNPLQNIASGGEISRVMLVLKAILARKNVMPTIIFDEIDTGVSGEVAFKMGNMLESMSHNLQLIVITHLPQIAAKGEKHYFVFKKQVGSETFSDIRELKEDERIHEIAEMMGGKAFGESILQSAKQLLMQ